ncbi:hypothetical protein MN116_007505 [Schistosoma mekongi]|uniref:Uncharacterized protein n=1 Tax=Schistosoma mekongi TaxID=38744 RepID=A0AAE1Z7J7_SCHME|nr:hypothetical protein MN116_007505 [Schistosoma mekongi]
MKTDCCTWSPDPLINGPGKCDCIIATILAVFSIVLLLIGIILTMLHYVIGMEFYTANRGRIIGPLLLGFILIPAVFIIYFVYMAKHKVANHVEQMTLNYCVKERMAYKQYQAELARSSIGIRSSSWHS